MKKFSILVILAASFLYFGCGSTSQNQKVLSTTENIAPKWITDQGRLEIFPSSSYVSQLAYGSSAQESKEKASASISEYIKASVTSSKSASYFYKDSGDSFTENRKLQQDIQISTSNNLYKIEYTNPYFYADLGQYACVAYINREQAFNFVRPKLEIARNQFPKAYHEALEKDSLLDKIIGIKHAQSVLPDFYEVYDFARAILPQKAKPYEETDALASESVLKMKEISSKVLIKIEGVGDTDLSEKSGVIAELAKQCTKMGFVVSNSLKTNCLALVEVKAEITETGETFETYPEIYIRILEKGAEKISYAKKLKKVAGFDKNTVIRRTNLALREEVSSSFVNECF
ncbi:hypothetical protein [uncultured Treponema sp.]|uniref:hypothetical protein n=1 Tax=uncultured Treponema sp. TaxID=162155 RepID=UPI0025FB42EA|nr:hypothetical protein [uncultured Treponema sp.]